MIPRYATLPVEHGRPAGFRYGRSATYSTSSSARRRIDIMIAAYTAAQMRAAEVPLLEAGVPLMQRAAAGLAREVRSLLGRDDARVLLLVGTGNNGADALYAGAMLAADGADVTIARTGDRVHAEALDAALAAGAHEAAATPPAQVSRLAASVDVVIDGILGTGTSANPALRGNARDIVEAIRAAGVTTPVVAVDIPSGIGPDDGSVPDPSVLRATLTVTFGGYKAGLLLAPASSFAGEVRLVDIGLGEQLAKVEPVLRLDALGGR
jgi:NAD(P)H-hydrate epimerase